VNQELEIKRYGKTPNLQKKKKKKRTTILDKSNTSTGKKTPE